MPIVSLIQKIILVVSLQVGSGLGNSAVHWGKLVKEQNGVVLATDSWVGDLTMWFSESWREAMAWQDGQSKTYERFLNHVVQNELTDTIIPLRAQSITAARMLHFLNYTVDAIYLDSAQVTVTVSLLFFLVLPCSSVARWASGDFSTLHACHASQSTENMPKLVERKLVLTH